MSFPRIVRQDAITDRHRKRHAYRKLKRAIDNACRNTDDKISTSINLSASTSSDYVMANLNPIETMDSDSNLSFDSITKESVTDSDCSSTPDESRSNSTTTFLTNWALGNNISPNALNDLLKHLILKLPNENIPKDAKTLLSNPSQFFADEDSTINLDSQTKYLRNPYIDLMQDDMDLTISSPSETLDESPSLLTDKTIKKENNPMDIRNESLVTSFQQKMINARITENDKTNPDALLNKVADRFNDVSSLLLETLKFVIRTDTKVEQMLCQDEKQLESLSTDIEGFKIPFNTLKQFLDFDELLAEENFYKKVLNHLELLSKNSKGEHVDALVKAIMIRSFPNAVAEKMNIRGNPDAEEGSAECKFAFGKTFYMKAICELISNRHLSIPKARERIGTWLRFSKYRKGGSLYQNRLVNLKTSKQIADSS